MHVFPDTPDAPEVGRVTHCSIELFWDQERHYDEPDSEGRIKYCVQEEKGNSRRYVYRLVCRENQPRTCL